MKILLVNRVLYPRGTAETIMFRLADALEGLGHQVCWLAREDRRNLELENSFVIYPPDLRNTPRREVRQRAVSDPDVYKCVERVVDEQAPDAALVFQITGTLTWAVPEALKRRGVPCFMMETDFTSFCPAGGFLRDGHPCRRRCKPGNWLPCVINCCVDGRLRPSLAAVRTAAWLRRRQRADVPTAWLTPSAYHERLLRKSRLTNKPIRCVDLPLPPEAFAPMETERGDYFLYVGRLEERKGCGVALTAMHSALRGKKLAFAGDGPLREELISEAFRLKVNKKVSFPGRLNVTALRQLISGCQAVIVPSLCEEVGPWALLEAQAAGKPVIAARTGVLPDRVTDTVDGYLYRADDPKALAGCMDAIAGMDDEEYAAMCAAAREGALERYAPEACARRVLEAIRDYAYLE